MQKPWYISTTGVARAHGGAGARAPDGSGRRRGPAGRGVAIARPPRRTAPAGVPAPTTTRTSAASPAPASATRGAWAAETSTSTWSHRTAAASSTVSSCLPRTLPASENGRVPRTETPWTSSTAVASRSGSSDTSLRARSLGNAEPPAQLGVLRLGIHQDHRLTLDGRRPRQEVGDRRASRCRADPDDVRRRHRSRVPCAGQEPLPQLARRRLGVLVPPAIGPREPKPGRLPSSAHPGHGFDVLGRSDSWSHQLEDVRQPQRQGQCGHHQQQLEQPG